MKILGIESSCDETAASVVEDGKTVLSNIVASQIDEHRLYGGVVPEIASRRHAENIGWVVREALLQANCTLADIDGIAVTYAPGLIGALLVGISFAKGLAMSSGIPLIPVHHIAGHIAANYITHPDLEPPYLCLVISGGHSHIIEVRDYTKYHVIGRTRDDAAGECFDKAARTLGYEYPGGKFIDAAAKLGKAQSTIANKLRLLRLTADEREVIMKYNLTERHARALLRLAAPAERLAVLERVVKQNLNVEKTEAAVEEVIGKKKVQNSYKKRSKVFQNVRIFVNTITKAVETMQAVGIAAESQKIQHEDYIEYRVKIPTAASRR